jgi:hypothetical protein
MELLRVMEEAHEKTSESYGNIASQRGKDKGC